MANPCDFEGAKTDIPTALFMFGAGVLISTIMEMLLKK